jgi:hypothetical protein
VVIVCGVLRIKLFYALVSVNDRRVRLNLCFRAAFLIIRRVLLTVSALKLRLKKAKQRKRLKLLTKRLNLSFASSRSLRLVYDVLIFVGS